jgi:hypothetical protein
MRALTVHEGMRRLWYPPRGESKGVTVGEFRDVEFQEPLEAAEHRA